ncbi:hypothetical protein WA026_012550 [Henosepilachna vigintioctopunctata]|uniref:Site-specific DNA endonuclease n=1 Tax=Henosepilachna vigintioctopunctata TaxID=420089 RepID=A0AAW1TXD7_9CUCU
MKAMFTTVNYKKRRNPEIVGNSKNTNLKGVPKMVSIYISRIDGDSTEESIKNHLIENGIKQFEIKMAYSKYPNIYESYIITVPSNIVEKIKEPQLWPERTSISHFLYQLAKSKNNRRTYGAIWAQTRIIYRNKINHFRSQLSEYEWNETFSSYDVNKSFQNFLSLFKEQYEIIFKLKTIESKSEKNWVTGRIITSCRKKLKLFDDLHLGVITKEHYKKYSKILKNTIGLAKRLSNENYIKQAKNKSKATLEVINVHTSKHKKVENILNLKTIRQQIYWI